MSQTVQIQSASFSLLAVAQGTDVSTVLLSYTMPPDAISPLIATDALNPGNYTITGPSFTSVALVTPLSSYMFSLTLTAPLISGSYTITAINVEANGSPLNAPTSLVFQAVAGTPKEPVNQGADNDLTENVLRRWLPPQYRYKTAWEALIAAIESGDRFVRENAYSAFDQLFLSSALRPYLFQRAADFGVSYPSKVGMGDNLFRQLAIKTTAKKLVHQALLEILEVFYGENATRANITSGLNEPFVLKAGDSIDFTFDDRDDVTVTFNSADFSNISVATASEVAAVLTRAFRAAGSAAYASARQQDDGMAVTVYSGALGLLGSVQVMGGMAQNSIQFPTRIPLFVSPLPAPAPTWTSVRVSQDEYRFTWTRDYVPALLNNVQVGDYVLLDFVNASTLRGSYEVTDVHINVNVTTGSPNGLTWFSIKPGPAFPYSYGNGVNITQTNVNEIVFYRIVRQTVTQGINPSFIAQYDQTGVDVILPATTQAVDRGATDAAYPPTNTPIGIISTARTSHIATVSTTVNHGLSIGQTVEIYGVTGITTGQWVLYGKILDTPTPSTFTISSPGVNGIGTGGYVLPVTAIASPGVVPGPFAFDPDSGYAVTGTSTTSTDAIAGLRGISTLNVASTAGFPDSGYLVFGFGTQYEVGPVKYAAILDTNTFIIDRTFTFPKDIPAGFDVTLLYQNVPWVPANIGDVGAFWLTDSSGGRIAAEGFINDAVASGVNVTNKIIYPGDRGIGGQGLPITGVKISDKVEVWSGDNTDQEVADAHNG